MFNERLQGPNSYVEKQKWQKIDQLAIFFLNRTRLLVVLIIFVVCEKPGVIIEMSL